MVACDDGEHFVSLGREGGWYGWVLRKNSDGCIYSVREATPEELKTAMTKSFFDSIPVIPPVRPHGRLA